MARRPHRYVSVVVAGWLLLASCATAAAPTAPTATVRPGPPATVPAATATASPPPPSPIVRSVPSASATVAAPAASVVATFDSARALEHVQALAGSIGVRATGTAGEASAADYLERQFQAAGYAVRREPFPVLAFEDHGANLQVDGDERAFQPATLRYSGTGQQRARLVDLGMGLEEDYRTARAAGAIVLVERGGASFQAKVAIAKQAGAVGVIIYNDAPGGFSGTLGEPTNILAVGLPRDEGLALRRAIGGGQTVTATLRVDASTTQRQSQNVIATRAGLPANLPIIVVGGHYDSVPAGPGANDNASGTAVMLELARALSTERRVELRFVGFGAEEIGLIGSRYHVAQLSPAERTRTIAMLNLDMLAVGEAFTLGGSDALVALASRQAADIGVTNSGRRTASSGSDHASFAAAGIPVLFINRPDDPTYHTARDVPANVSQEALRLAGEIALGMVRFLAGMKKGAG